MRSPNRVRLPHLRHNTGIYPRVMGTRHFFKTAYPDPRVFSPVGIIGGDPVKSTVYPGNTCRNLSNALPGSNTRGYYISGYPGNAIPMLRLTHAQPLTGESYFA